LYASRPTPPSPAAPSTTYPTSSTKPSTIPRSYTRCRNSSSRELSDAAAQSTRASVSRPRTRRRVRLPDPPNRRLRRPYRRFPTHRRNRRGPRQGRRLRPLRPCRRRRRRRPTTRRPPTRTTATETTTRTATALCSSTSTRAHRSTVRSSPDSSCRSRSVCTSRVPSTWPSSSSSVTIPCTTTFAPRTASSWPSRDMVTSSTVTRV
jgi:hypothetical protein